ncbi:MAG TPA: RNA polymerase sigma factor [Myxococcota bacterium]
MSAAPVAHSPSLPPPSAAVSFDDVYAREVRWVWRALWRLGVPDRDLEDVAHDVFVVVHRKLADYDQSRPLRPWLFGICFRVALDRRRKHAVQRELPTDMSDLDERADARVVDAVDVVRHHERQALVQAALATLPLEQRALFVLHELEGVAVADCVTTLAAPLNTLYSRLRLARASFARAIARLGDGSAP